MGGVIGAAVGSNAGHNHHDNVVGAAVGAVVGGVIGAGIASNDINVHYDHQVNCRNSRHYSRNRIEGYNVTFVMDGERYQVFTNANPGSRMKVKMTLEVVE